MPATIRNELPLIEPAMVPDVFAVGMEPIMGDDYVRLVFWVDNQPARERLTVAKLVMTRQRFRLVRATLIVAGAYMLQ